MANKKITPKTVKAAENKAFNKKRKVTIVNKFGDSYDVVYDEEIRLTKLMKILEEVKERLVFLNKHNLLYDMTAHVYILFIKYFTDIEFPEIVGDTAEELEQCFKDEMAMMEALIDLDLYSRIIDNFTESNIAEIQKFLDEYFSKGNLELAELALTGKINELLKNGEDRVFEDLKTVEEYLNDSKDTVEQ